VAAIVYDTGALLAAERRNPDFLALHDELTAARIRPIVPVVVLAQAWRGGPQHQISRVLKACDIIPDDERTGRAAGVACAASGTADVVDAIVDAIVVATAVRHQAPVVTSDPGGLTHIANSIGVKIQLYPT
jgi:predicted nucleic acid-binding protein